MRKGREEDYDCRVTVWDVREEMRRLRKEVTKSPTKQSLASPASRKVQKSIRAWFSPTGKENAELDEPSTKEANAESEVKGKLKGKMTGQTQREKEKVLAAKPSKSGRSIGVNRTKQSVSECASNLNLLKLSPTSKCVSDLNLPKPLTSECASDLFSSEPSASDSECSSNLNWSKPSTSNCAPRLSRPKQSTLECSPCLTLPEPSSSTVRATTSRVNLPQSSDCARKLNPPKPAITHCAMNSKSSPSSSAEEMDFDLPAHSSHGGGDETDSMASCSNSSVNCLIVVVSKQSETQSKVSSSSSFVSGIRMNRKSSVSAPTPSDGTRAAPSEPTSSDSVLSAWSLNKTRTSKRTRTPTERMSSFMTNLRKRKKPDGIESETDSAEQSLAEASPAKLTETLPPRRPKTVRGISQKLAVARFLQPSASESDSDLKAERSQTETLKSETSAAAAVDSRPAESLLNERAQPGSSSSPLKRKFNLVDLQSENASSPVKLKGRVPSTRWRLSSVPLPGQVDIAGCGASRLQELGSRTIPESLSLMVSSCLDENDFESAVATAMSETTSCPSVEMFKHMVTVVKVGCWSFVELIV